MGPDGQKECEIVLTDWYNIAWRRAPQRTETERFGGGFVGEADVWIVNALNFIAVRYLQYHSSGWMEKGY